MEMLIAIETEILLEILENSFVPSASLGMWDLLPTSVPLEKSFSELNGPQGGD